VHDGAFAGAVDRLHRFLDRRPQPADFGRRERDPQAMGGFAVPESRQLPSLQGFVREELNPTTSLPSHLL
jgi:hypothetical protein